jgi:hypothetical protein
MRATQHALERVERLAAEVLGEDARGWRLRCEPDPTHPRGGEPPVRTLVACGGTLLVLCRTEETLLLSDAALSEALRRAWREECLLVGPLRP